MALAVALAHRFFYIFNPDSIALLQLAHYWWHGQWSLALSSYWGPLFSVLLSPLLGIGIEPFLAGRIAMIVSALIYVVGARALLKALGIVSIPLELCTLLVGIIAALYSAMMPTADLLMSGLISFGLSQLLSANWTASRITQFAAGILLGMAYLSKAIALPLTVLVIFAVALVNFWPHSRQRRRVIAASIATCLAFALFVSPWIGALSLKFGTLMFSSSGALNHTIAGPSDVDRYHPVGRTFHIPRDNRKFAWEDPFGMPYRHWSPFESRKYLRYQIWLIQSNAQNIVATLGIGLVTIALIAFVTVRPWRGGPPVWWAWTLPLVGLMSCLYLPVFADSPRYYLLSYPPLLGCAVMLIYGFGKRFGLRAKAGLLLAIVVSGMLAFQNQIRPAWSALHQIDGEYGFAMRQALPMARQIVATHGPIEVASVGDDWRVGMFIAYALNSRWRGNVPNPTFDEVKRSGAQLFVVKNGHSLLPEFAADPGMQEENAPEPLAGLKTKSGKMRYFWYKKLNDQSETRHE